MCLAITHFLHPTELISCLEFLAYTSLFGKLFDRRILFQNGKRGLTVDIAEKLLELRKNELNNVVYSHFSFSEIFCNKISFSCYGL